MYILENGIKLIQTFGKYCMYTIMNTHELILDEKDDMVFFDLDKHEFSIIGNKIIIARKQNHIEKEKEADRIPEYISCPLLENYINHPELWPKKHSIKKRLQQIKEILDSEKVKIEAYDLRILDIKNEQIEIEEEQSGGLGKHSRACYLIQTYGDLVLELEHFYTLKIQSIVLLKNCEKEVSELVKKI